MSYTFAKSKVSMQAIFSSAAAAKGIAAAAASAQNALAMLVPDPRARISAVPLI